MNTRTEHRPPVRHDHHSEQLPASPSGGENEPPSPRAGLSPAQTLGGALAAATAAALGSRLGVVGTITGAALVSVIASLAGAVYTTSLRHTGRKVSTVLRTTRGGGPPAGAAPRAGNVRVAGRGNGLTVRRVLVGAVTVFALTAGGVTAVEAISGRSLEGDSGGTTVGRTVETTTGTTGGAGGSTEPSTPTPSEATTPSVSAPSPTPSPTEGSGTEATQTPSPTVSPSPSDASSTDGTPSADPTPSSTGDASDGTGDADPQEGGDPVDTGENPVSP